MKNCSSCSNSAKVYCSACQDSYCTHCLVIKHLSSDSFESHSMTYVCEECEEGIAIKICDTCDQTMCLECDTSIHNKGKRAQHTRRSALESIILKKICNLAFLTLAYCNETLNIDSISPESLKTKFFELVTEMDQKTGEKNLISLIIVETNKPDQKKSQLLQNIKLKNVVILEENFQDLPWNQGKTNKLSKLDADINLFFDFKKSSSTLISLGFLENHDSIFVYDVTSTPNVEHIGQFFNNNTPNSLPAKNSSPPNRNAENATTESLSFDQILTTTNSNSPKDLNTCLEASDEFLCGDDDSFDGNSLKMPENFSQQDLSFSSFGVPQSTIIDAWSLKENMTVNSFFSVSPDSKNNKTSSPVGQPLREIEIQGSTKRGDVIQQVLMKFAEKGELLVPKETAVSTIMDLFKLSSPNHAEAILRECEAKKVVHTTVRKFLYDGPYFYIGLLLDTLTPESLAWVIRSIKNDLMTPTEKLVVSRIKECYGLKIEQNQWKLILDYLAVNQNFGGKKGSSLYTKKIQDPVTNMETNALYLRNEEWTPEDQGTVDDTTDEWKMFLIFMENFFNEEPQKVQKRFDLNEDNNKNGMWHNSVENVLNKLPHDHDRGLRVSEDVRAIPGGRYGCAQFIKYCGPDNLKELSIGRLTLLVQEAINRGIIKYQRTLLVKNTVNDGPTALPGHSEFEAEVIHSINNERKAKVISMVREALLQILMEKENSEGVSLAQIPFYLKRKLKFAVDFQELGYPKLKNFLSTLKNLVVINSIGANHTYVKLKGPLPSQTVNDITFHQAMQKNNKRPKDQVLKKSPVPFTPVRNIDNHQNPAKNLNEEFSAILDTIDYLTKQNPNGLTLQDLDMKLCDAIKGVIQFKIFGCQNFYDFLLQYADQIVDIEARKDCYIIYPKVSNFWNKDKPFYPPVLQQNNSFKSPQQNYETPNRSFKSAESSTMHSGSRHFMSASTYKSGSQNGFSVHHDSPLMSNAQTPTFNFPINCSTPSTAYSSHHVLSNTRENFMNGSTMMGMSPMQDLGNFAKPDFVKKSRGLEHRNVNVSDWNSSFPFNNNKVMQDGANNNQFGARNFRNFPQYAKGDEPDFENVRFIEGLIGDREENKNQFGYYRNVSNNNNMSTERSGLGYQGFRKNPMCKFVS